MIRNRRGQFFSLWLVFIVLSMMAIVIGLFYLNQNEISGSVVSPMNVLSERDNLKIFEGKEIVAIRNSLRDASGEFGSNEFHNSFRALFFNAVERDAEMSDFLFGNVSIDDLEIRERDKNRNLIENGIYPKIKSEFTENGFVFARVAIEKKYDLSSREENRVNFPVKMNYEFERKYLIKKVGNEFEVSIL